MMLDHGAVRLAEISVEKFWKVIPLHYNTEGIHPQTTVDHVQLWCDYDGVRWKWTMFTFHTICTKSCCTL